MTRKDTMNLQAPLAALWLLVMTRIFGGALLLWLLDAPAWVIAAWFLLHLRFNIRLRDGAKETS